MGKTTIEIENVSKAYGENTLIRDFSYIFLKHDRIGFVGKNGCGKTTLVKMIADGLSRMPAVLKLDRRFGLVIIHRKSKRKNPRELLIWMRMKR